VIEVVHDQRCIDCGRCVEVCPTNVFDELPSGHPVIARQSDCQTCFMCEAWCPVDALFVASQAGPVPPDSPEKDLSVLEATGRFGEYRRWIGWGSGRKPGTLRDRNADLPALIAEDRPGTQFN
jgi:NAD-dependent dihydropyrimidine dehydrogenase PreA subunit